MIALSFVDYGLIAAALVVLLIKIVADIREVISARASRGAMKTIAKRHFSPLLTVIIPFDSLTATKQAIVRLRKMDCNIAVLVAVDSTKNSSAASQLRYFIKKNSISKAAVTASKKIDVTAVAKNRVKSGLVVVLPETAELHDSFYFDAIVPFGSATLDAVQLLSNVRPDRSLLSGIEVLASTWRNYFSLPRPHAEKGLLVPGVIVRVKHLRRPPKRPLKVVSTQRSPFSIGAQTSQAAVWRHMKNSVSAVEYVTISLSIGVITMLLQAQDSRMFLGGAFALLYVALVWWSLGLTRVAWFDKISLILLAPFFFFGMLVAVAAKVFQMIATAWSQGYRTLRYARSS